MKIGFQGGVSNGFKQRDILWMGGLICMEGDKRKHWGGGARQHIGNRQSPDTIDPWLELVSWTGLATLQG